MDFLWIFYGFCRVSMFLWFFLWFSFPTFFTFFVFFLGFSYGFLFLKESPQERFSVYLCFCPGESMGFSRTFFWQGFSKVFF